MSVLSVPRVHFRGKASWNPATANNNDQWPIYNFPDAELYWKYLNTVGITEENVRQEFPKWALEPKWYPDPNENDPTKGWWQPPAEWNYFGGMEWSLHSDTEHTAVTGGQLRHGGHLITDDPVVGAAFDVVGDTFPGGTFNTPARFVDNNPDSFWSSAFYLKRFQLGTRPAPEYYLSGPIQPDTYLASRLFNLQYNMNADGKLQIAGVGGTVLQGCMPTGSLQLEPRDSLLLSELKSRLDEKGVLGLMVRCTAYLTRYFTLDAFDCVSGISDKYQRTSAQYRLLAELWQEQLAKGRTPVANPAVSSVVGTIGLWHDTDPVTNNPGGRFLVPVASVPDGQGKPTGLWPGPAVLETHPDGGTSGKKCRIILDLATTVPGLDSTGRKKDLGTLELDLVTGTGSQPLAKIPLDRYDRAAFEARAGIVDLEVPASVTDRMLAEGTLELACRPPNAARMVLLRERTITVETEQRSVFVEQGHTAQIVVQVRERGAIPQRDVEIRAHQYVPAPEQPLADGTYWQEPEATNSKKRYVELKSETILVPKGTGRAVLEIGTVNPGCAVIAFFPKDLFPKQQPDTIPPRIGLCPMPEGKAWGPSYESTPWTFYTCVRVLPFDDELPQKFWDAWKASGCDPEFAWKYVYKKVLYLHDVLYPVMRYMGGLDLGDKASVDKNIDQIVDLSDPSLRDTTVYMPVSRELSAGKRDVLRIYQAIVHAVNNGDDPKKLEKPV